MDDVPDLMIRPGPGNGRRTVQTYDGQVVARLVYRAAGRRSHWEVWDADGNAIFTGGRSLTGNKAVLVVNPEQAEDPKALKLLIAEGRLPWGPALEERREQRRLLAERLALQRSQHEASGKLADAAAELADALEEALLALSRAQQAADPPKIQEAIRRGQEALAKAGRTWAARYE